MRARPRSKGAGGIPSNDCGFAGDVAGWQLETLRGVDSSKSASPSEVDALVGSSELLFAFDVAINQPPDEQNSAEFRVPDVTLPRSRGAAVPPLNQDSRSSGLALAASDRPLTSLPDGGALVGRSSVSRSRGAKLMEHEAVHLSTAALLPPPPPPPALCGCSRRIEVREAIPPGSAQNDQNDVGLNNSRIHSLGSLGSGGIDELWAASSPGTAPSAVVGASSPSPGLPTFGASPQERSLLDGWLWTVPRGNGQAKSLSLANTLAGESSPWPSLQDNQVLAVPEERLGHCNALR